MDGVLLLPQRAIHVGQKFRTLEPPVPEQLSVERRRDYTLAVLGLAGRDSGEQMREMIGVTASPI